MNQLLVAATSVLEGFDWIVLAIYFLALVAVAVWVVIQKNNNTEDYFLAGRNVGWFVIGASILHPTLDQNTSLVLQGLDLNLEPRWPIMSFTPGLFYC